MSEDAGSDARDALAASWRVLALPGAVSVASYLTSPNAKQYRLLVDLLFDQQTSRLTGVAHDELLEMARTRLAMSLEESHARTLLEEDDFPLERRMAQLVEWGTCQSWQDTARTESDFLRNRARYQLTEEGAAINRLVRELEAGRESGSSAAVLAPPILRADLAAAAAAAAEGDSPAVGEALARVQTTLADMARTASGWQSRLAAALGGTPDPDKVERVLSTIVDYVDMWGSGVDVFSADIAHLARGLADLDDQTWRAVAFPRVGAEADEDRVTAVVAELRGTVDTVLAWFAGPRAQARALRIQIRDAVSPLLKSHRTLLAVGGGVSRRADLLLLAGDLERAPDDAAAWRLWCTATGLYPARHLGLLAPDLREAHSVSSWEAPPVPLERRLRTHGARALVGRTARISDTSTHRRLARERAARERARWAEAESALVARNGTAMSTWSPLGEAEAELLLDLIASARSRPADVGGARHGVSSDGRWRIRLAPTPDLASAVLRTPSGRLALADAVVEVSR